MLLQLHVAAYWLFLQHTSKIVNYKSNSLEFNLGMSFRLYNVRGGPTTEVQHTAAYCGTMLHTGLDPRIS